MICRFVIAGTLLLGSAAAGAESFDGAYTGTLSCPAFPGQTPLRAEISVTVAERTATYELRPDAATGVSAYERGGGTVSPSGEIVLSGSCEGGFSCATDYRGDLGATPIRLRGSQRWWFRGGDRQRECEMELTRPRR